MLKKLLISTVAIMALSQNINADDYNLYGEWSPDNLYSYYDATGFIDNTGLLGGKKGDQYIFFNSGGTGYIYKVEVNGDPNAYPNVADRNFTFISSHPLPSSGGSDEFYVDTTGIYFGSGKGIKRWDFDWSNETDVLGFGLYSQTLARNTTTGEWWTATGNRDVYKYNNVTNTWDFQFTYPNLAGSHHDGMEIINNKLYLSDMTSDKIIVYDLNSTGSVEDTSNYTIYDYSANPVVEGMGFGPNQHFWIGGGNTIYEIGDGVLVPSCTQTFHYNERWDMQTSKCDDMTVPGFDDTLIMKITNGQMEFATADLGTIAWLNRLGFTAKSSLTLKAGEGFWTYGKFDGIEKTINNGKLRNNFVDFKNGVYTFVGFSSAINLNSKFAGKPVEAVYYYVNNKWNTWHPEDGDLTVLGGQGLYVLANGDFSLLVN